MRISECRACGSVKLRSVLDLGEHPVTNNLLTAATLNEPEPKYPLEVLFCEECFLLQVAVTVPPQVLYQQSYPYFSSTNPSLVEHGRQHVEALIAERDLDENSFVVEVASNDGYLLQHFVKRGVPVLGIDPADGPALAAQAKRVPTINNFFSNALARELATGRKADVMIASNVVAHVDQINDFVTGFRTLLARDGIAIFEFAYAIDTIHKNEFDQIYHEHLFYHTLTGFKNLIERNGLYLNDVHHLPIHGGSLRVRVSHENAPSEHVTALLAAERQLGVHDFAFYQKFAAAVAENVRTLKEMLSELREGGYSIACYGAASKGATLLNTLNLGEGFFEFVADLSEHKQGKFMPGQKIPIVAPDKLTADAAPYCLLLVWNFAEDVMRQRASYIESGGHFILPVPTPEIVPPPVC